ncbi:A-kinase anchor protein 7-like isoform X2 [Macrobrachium rosenbergii]|uniref:A-kinase anchor protein 7-like isoform X2 n=1 Tax=Macrobrachium rosenbergii TaxID=79674 RepID=UPI0034D560ED
MLFHSNIRKNKPIALLTARIFYGKSQLLSVRKVEEISTGSQPRLSFLKTTEPSKLYLAVPGKDQVLAAVLSAADITMDCRSDHDEDSENFTSQDHQRKRVGGKELWDEQSPPAKKRTTESEGEECEISLQDYKMSEKSSEENASLSASSPVFKEPLVRLQSLSDKVSAHLSVRTDSLESSEDSLQSTENLSSCDVSLGFIETECESLESSMLFMGNSLDDLSTSALDDDKDKMGAESADGTSSQPGTKEKKKKRKRKRKTSKSEVESVDNKLLSNVRPNFFVGVQVSDSEIHKNIIKVQEALLAFEPAFSRALVDVATSHITLLIARIDDENALSLATSALEEYVKGLEQGVEPIQLTFSGVDNFSNSVIYARVIEDEHHQKLIDISAGLRQVFAEKGVCMPNTKPLNPHLTIAKMSKAPRGKGKQCPRKIDPQSYESYRELFIGSQPVQSLQLLSMNLPKDEKRYYYCCKEIPIGKSVVKNKDHSQCCFPRRPVISNQSRSFSTRTPKEPFNFVASSVGFMTALAASLMIVYVVGKVSGKL